MLIDLSFIIIMQDTIRVASGIISSNQEIESQVSKQANARDLFKNASLWKKNRTDYGVS